MRLFSALVAATLVGIGADSVRAETASGGPGFAPASGIEWVRYTDPAEQAYQIDVPKGWSVESSTLRSSPVNLSFVTRMLSPDKSVYIFFGDTELAAHSVPSSISRMRGQVEGTRYVTAGGQQNLVMRYLPGEQYARYFVETRFAQSCAGPKILSAKARTDVPPAAPGIPTVTHRGEVDFSCRRGDRDLAGHAEALTHVTGTGEIQTWFIDLIDGFVAPSERGAEAAGIVAHVLASAKLSPAWSQMESQLAQGNVAAAQRQFALGEQQRAAVNRRFAAADQNFQAMDDIITGTGHYLDPSTGARYDLDTSSPYKWMDGTGRIVGTDTPQPPPGPPLGWHKLDQAPQ
jgi:hypothetical protein